MSNPHRHMTIVAALSPVLLMAAPSVAEEAPSALQLRWSAPLQLNSPTNVVIGHIDQKPRFCLQGSVQPGERTNAAVEMLDENGRSAWIHTHQDPASSLSGAYLHWLTEGLADQSPVVLFSWVPSQSERPGGAHLVRASDGQRVGSITNTTHFGNNNSLVTDLDGDGQAELVYADQRTLTHYSLPGLEQRWRSDTAVLFCWSLPAAVDLNGDGRREIVFGSEYDNDDESSSMVAIDANGKHLWRQSGFAEDLGSTPVIAIDIDGDGTDELLKVGLDLEHRRRQEWNHIHVFTAGGQLVRRIPFGCTGVALGDLNGDGHCDGVGLRNTRDGGTVAANAIRAADLVTGEALWSTSVFRAYLDTNSPLMADVDDDGQLEAIVGTGNPAGYGRLPDSEPWGDLYVVNNAGHIEQHIALPGWPVNFAFCDFDDDGRGELIVVVDGLPGRLHVYNTSARTMLGEWTAPFGTESRNGLSVPIQANNPTQ